MEQSPFREANGFAVSQEFQAYCGTWRFITAFASTRYMSLAWAISIQSIPPHPTSRKTHLSILPSTPVFQVVSFPQVSPSKPCLDLSSPHTCHISRPSRSSRFDPLNNTVYGAQIIMLLIMQASPTLPPPNTPSILGLVSSNSVQFNHSSQSNNILPNRIFFRI